MSEQGPSGYAVWTVMRDPLTASGTVAGSETLADAVAGVEAGGVTVRGIYDVSAMRADADLMLWLHGDTAEGLQAAIRRLRRSSELAPLALTWSAMEGRFRLRWQECGGPPVEAPRRTGFGSRMIERGLAAELLCFAGAKIRC